MPHQDGFAQQSHLGFEHGHPGWVIVFGLPKTCLRKFKIHCLCPVSEDASHVVNPRSRLRTKPRPGSAKIEGYLSFRYLYRFRILENHAQLLT